MAKAAISWLCQTCTTLKDFLRRHSFLTRLTGGCLTVWIWQLIPATFSIICSRIPDPKVIIHGPLRPSESIYEILDSIFFEWDRRGIFNFTDLDYIGVLLFCACFVFLFCWAARGKALSLLLALLCATPFTMDTTARRSAVIMLSYFNLL